MTIIRAEFIAMKRVLDISNTEISVLIERAKGDQRTRSIATVAYGRKMYPTRHGYQGATDCNYSYGSYPG